MDLPFVKHARTLEAWVVGYYLSLQLGGDSFHFTHAMAISIGKILACEDRGKHHLLFLNCKTVYIFKNNNQFMFLNCISSMREIKDYD